MTVSSTLDIIARRYSCRSFRPAEVPANILQTIAEAGLRAPSARNIQPWRLSVIGDRAAVAEVSEVGLACLKEKDPTGYERVMARGGVLLYNAPAMIVVSTPCEPMEYPAAMDAGIVVSHLTLAAASLGLESCIVAMPKVAFLGGTDPDLRARYIPRDFEFAVAVLFGYAASPGGLPHEPDLAKISYF